MKEWCDENGRYDILIGSSSRDIRLSASIMVDREMSYTLGNITEAMIG